MFSDPASLHARLLWFQHAARDGMDRDTAFRTAQQAIADRTWNDPDRKFACQSCLFLLIDEAYGPIPPADSAATGQPDT